jgi:hypothetical protein
MYWVTCSRLGLDRFRSTRAVFPFSPSPTSREKNGFILSFASLRLQSMWPIRSRSRLSLRTTSLEISVPIATSAPRIHLIRPGSQPLVYLPSPAFLPLSTVCSPRSLAGLFHPAATYGFHPSRAFPTAKPLLLIEAPCLHDVFRPSPITHRSE